MSAILIATFARYACICIYIYIYIMLCWYHSQYAFIFSKSVCYCWFLWIDVTYLYPLVYLGSQRNYDSARSCSRNQNKLSKTNHDLISGLYTLLFTTVLLQLHKCIFIIHFLQPSILGYLNALSYVHMLIAILSWLYSINWLFTVTNGIGAVCCQMIYFTITVTS